MNKKILASAAIAAVTITLFAYMLNTQSFVDEKISVAYPKITGTIKCENLTLLLQQTFNTTKIYTQDLSYSVTSLEQAINFSRGHQNLEYIPEAHDCDNFAKDFLGYWNRGNTSFAFGLLVGIQHTANFFVDDKLQVYVVEPQTHVFMLAEKALQRSDGKYVPVLIVC